MERNIKGYNSEVEFEHIIQSSKIWPSCNIPINMWHCSNLPPTLGVSKPRGVLCM